MFNKECALGAHQRPFQSGLEIGPAGDLAAHIADEAAQPRAQQGNWR